MDQQAVIQSNLSTTATTTTTTTVETEECVRRSSERWSLWGGMVVV